MIVAVLLLTAKDKHTDAAEREEVLPPSDAPPTHSY